MIGMTKAAMLFLLGAAVECALAPSAFAQLSLYTVNEGVETPVGLSSAFGPVANGSSEDVEFRLKYTGNAATYNLNYLSVGGTGFSVAATDWQSLPAVFPASGYLDFTITFQPDNPGTQPQNYSANLVAYGTQGVDNILVYLLGTGTPGLTVLLNNQPFPAGQTVGFGDVQVGSPKTVTLILANQTSAALTVPAVQLLTGAFSVTGATSRPSVEPGSSVELDIVFAPTVTGPQRAALTIGVLSFPLQGNGAAATAPVLPQPSIQISLPVVASAQQGAIGVSLAAASTGSATGTMTLVFTPAAGLSDDPTVILSNGTRSASFTVALGASTGQFSGEASISFQTGTTAGILAFTVSLGSHTAQASIVIPAAIIGINAVVATRNVSCAPADLSCSASNIGLKVNGWDNTRVASTMVFSFYNSSGSVIAPGNVSVDGTSAFQQYFATSVMGGVFALNALFPVTGDTSQVVGVEVQFTNSAGTAQTAIIEF